MCFPEHPLHSSYEKLSYIQRSDYLRAYLMHHHGGVYMDIKPMDKPWLPLLEELNATPDMWVIAPHEIGSWNSSPASGVLGKDQRNYYKSVVNMSAFGCKPYSRFTDEWIAEVKPQDGLFFHPCWRATEILKLLDICRSTLFHGLSWRKDHKSLKA